MKTDPISAAVAYRMALEKIVKAPSLSASVREAQRALQHTFDRPEEGMVSLTSGYGHNTKQPFVTFSLANPSESAKARTRPFRWPALMHGGWRFIFWSLPTPPIRMRSWSSGCAQPTLKTARLARY